MWAGFKIEPANQRKRERESQGEKQEIDSRIYILYIRARNASLMAQKKEEGEGEGDFLSVEEPGRKEIGNERRAMRERTPTSDTPFNLFSSCWIHAQETPRLLFFPKEKCCENLLLTPYSNNNYY